MQLIVLPAYGRSYKSSEDALTDWYTGKDFKVARGPYLSIRDTKTLAVEGVTSMRLVWDLTTMRTTELMK